MLYTTEHQTLTNLSEIIVNKFCYKKKMYYFCSAKLQPQTSVVCEKEIEMPSQ